MPHKMDKAADIDRNILKQLVYLGRSHNEIAKTLKCSKDTIAKELKRQKLQLKQLSVVARACRYLSKSGEKITISGDEYFVGGHSMSGDEIIFYANDLKIAEKGAF